MENMFNGASTFNQAINMWNTNNVSSYTNMFYNSTSINQHIVM